MFANARLDVEIDGWMSAVFGGSRPFVLRPMVCVLTSLGLGGAVALTGAIRFAQPASSRPH